MAVMACAFLAPRPTLADESAELDRARELAIEGIVQFDAGHNEVALENLASAYQLVRLPTLALYQARALVRLGRWVEALALYDEATELPITTGDVDTQKRACADAAREGAELRPRIPRIAVEVQGVDIGIVTLRVDGDSVPAAELQAGTYRVDPGPHLVEAQAGDQTQRTTLTLEAEQTQRTTLVFEPVATVSVVPTPTGPWPPATVTENPAAVSPPGTERPGLDRRSIPNGVTWAALGAGTAGVVVGATAGAMALEKRGWLKDHCQGTDCPPEYHGDVDIYRRERIVSAAGFVVGGAGVATSIVLLFVQRRQSPTVGRRVTPWLGIDHAGVAARF